MKSFLAHASAVAVLVLGACSLDSTNPSGTGTGGGASSGGPSSNGVTQPTTGSTTDTTTSGMGGMASSSGAAMTSGATTDAASSSSDAASSSSVGVSSSSGGPTDFPFCTNIADNFNGYANDGEFATMGEMFGPWGEFGNASASVLWMNPGQIQTKHESNTAAYLFTKGKFALPATPCAITMKLVSVGSGDHLATFGLSNASFVNLQTAGITCKANGQSCVELTGFGFNAISLTPPFTLGIVVKAAHVTALYNQGGTWTKLPSTAAPPGFDISAWAGGGVSAYAGQDTGGDHSEWDDFNILPIPLAAAP